MTATETVSIARSTGSLSQVSQGPSSLGRTTELTFALAFTVYLPAAFNRILSRMAFASYLDGNVDIFVMNADGTGQINLTNNPADDVNPDW